MSRNAILAIVGGALIVVSLFFAGNELSFNFDTFKNGLALVTLLAGIGVIVFTLVRNGKWAAYSAIAAATIFVAGLLTAIFAGALDITLGFILLLVGVVLAVYATVFVKDGK